MAWVFAISSRSSMPMRLIEEADVRQRGLAHADDADLARFDQADLRAAPAPNTEAKAAAVIQPAVPPPTITILSGGGTRAILSAA